MSSTWHAHASGEMLATTTEIPVTGGHDRVRIRTADRISIEMPDRNRLSAVAIDHTEDHALLAIGASPVRLRTSTKIESFEGFKLSDGVSRQDWIVR